MLRSYTRKLCFRVAILISIIFIYFFEPYIMELIFSKRLYGRLVYLYIIWGIFMFGMLLQMIPRKDTGVTMGCLKHHEILYVPTGLPYTEKEKKDFIVKSDKGALIVLASWLMLTAAIGVLYFSGIIAQKTLLLLALVFYVCDLVCVVIWCPFQRFMMKNKCCVNCRIFNWGYAMMFSPLIFIRSFFSWSLVLMSLIVVITWEIRWHRHPERFWHRTNSALQCKNCTDKICGIKKPLLIDSAMYEYSNTESKEANN